MKYKLVRERDGLTKIAPRIKWVAFDENGRGSKTYDEIGVDRSLLLAPLNINYTWMTTTVKSFDVFDDRIEFSTQNSNYTLTEEEDG